MLTTRYELIPPDQDKTYHSQTSLTSWKELMAVRFPSPSVGDVVDLDFNGIRKMYKCIKITDCEPYWQKVKEVRIKIKSTDVTQETTNIHGVNIDQLSPLSKRLVMENKISFDSIKSPYRG